MVERLSDEEREALDECVIEIIAAYAVRASSTKVIGELRDAVEAIMTAHVEARLAAVQAILTAWDAWDGSPGPDGKMHPDSSSARDRDRLRAALGEDA